MELYFNNNEYEFSNDAILQKNIILNEADSIQQNSVTSSALPNNEDVEKAIKSILANEKLTKQYSEKVKNITAQNKKTDGSKQNNADIQAIESLGSSIQQTIINIGSTLKDFSK